MLPHSDRHGEGRRHGAAAEPLVQPRQPGRRQRLPDLPARARREQRAQLRRRTRPQLCPYLTASGATVFNGPVYRYDDDAEDNSARWPEYWDGRWFLQDFGNNSAKHGLLLDPATDQDGGQPVYADSLRGVLNWQANYMDSKFGPDGALYVQVYSGFFTTGPQAGLYRFAYTGGAGHAEPRPAVGDDRHAAPDPLLARQLGRRLLRVGLRRRQPDLDRAARRRTSTRRPGRTRPSSPSRTPTARSSPRPSQVNVERRRRRADHHRADDRHQPGRGPAERDRRHGRHRRRVDRVPRRRRRLDAQREHRRRPTRSSRRFTVRGQGAHTVEFRSRDRAGNVEDPPGSVSFTIEPPGGGGSSCLPQSDEFGGTALDSKWTVLRPDGGGPTVADGSVGLPFLQGDFIANDPLASNTLLQDAPSGEWTVTARLDTSRSTRTASRRAS